MGGDFNTTRHQWEKKDGLLVRDQFQENLEDIIQNFNMLDIDFVVIKFTWNNKSSGPRHILPY